MEDKIAKQKLNIILLVDASKSMQGKRIGQVDQAVKEIKDYLINLQDETTNVDFYLTIIPFNNSAYFYNNLTAVEISQLKYDGIKCGGWSNLHCAYEKLGEILKKESKGGIMPDFGGVAPIILLLTDGHPTGKQYKEVLASISSTAWFKASLRYGVAIELDDATTDKVLREFCGKNGDVVRCVDANMLKNIIKIIVLTASKVKSGSSNVSYNPNQAQPSSNGMLQQTIAEALNDMEDLEW